jgi:tripartite-type tricarboxylate transporter receptor subunit TctC
MQDLIGGRIDYMCDVTSTSLRQAEGGTIKPIAILTLRRNEALPNLATATEQASRISSWRLERHFLAQKAHPRRSLGALPKRRAKPWTPQRYVGACSNSA